MKLRTTLTTLLVGFGLAVTPAFATISIVGGLPADSIIAVDSSVDANGATRITPPGGATWHIKGNSFTITSPLDITSVTVRIDDDANNAPVDNDGNLTLDFFSIDMMPDNTQNTGQVPTAGPIYSQTDPISGFATGDYLKIDLATPLSVTPGFYGFTVGTEDMEFFMDIRNDAGNLGYADGELIRTRTDTGAWQDRNFDVVFGIQAVPEPAGLLPMVLGGLALLLIRKRN